MNEPSNTTFSPAVGTMSVARIGWTFIAFLTFANLLSGIYTDGCIWFLSIVVLRSGYWFVFLGSISVGLTLAAVQIYLPGIGNDHFMAQCKQQSTDPRRMCADFHADSTAAHRPKHLGYGFLAGADVAFLNHFACFIQNAVAARAIPQIQTDRELVLIENLASASSNSATLFHSRSPFPCASSALIIGSVSHPAETGLLIPSRK